MSNFTVSSYNVFIITCQLKPRISRQQTLVPVKLIGVPIRATLIFFKNRQTHTQENRLEH